jgi:hypothetical protein
MDFLKSALLVLSDPIVQIFFVLLLGLLFHSFRKWLKFEAYYFILVSSSVFYVTASTVWSVQDKIYKDFVNYVS